ncbi:MAG: Gfo/Idh/MocA family oxidoreductase [bacterium]|nr:MAG: Gfo/Idh/MocA family oxidoreductase [bacterium]
MKPIKITIIGLRHLHPRSYMAHFQSIKEIEVIAVAEQDEALRTKFADDFQLKAYATWKELFDKEEVDLAAIFLPYVDCPEAALGAIEKCIHVMIEKPMTVDSESAEKIVKAAERKGVMVTTPYVWRYHPVVRDIKRLIDEGVLGHIIGCEGRCAAGRLNRYIEGHAEWMLDAEKSGGGPMYNLGVHWIDLFSWLLGDEIVSAFGKNVKINQQYNIEDNSFTILTFKSGAILNLDISYSVPESYPYGRDLYIGIRGTKGVIQWSPAFEGEKDELFICSDQESFKAAPRQRRWYEIQPTTGYSGVMGLDYLTDVARSILEKKAAPIPGAEGVRVLKVVEAIYQSAEQQKMVLI